MNTTTEDAVEKKGSEHYNFTEEDIDSCLIYYKSYFIDILNGEYDLQEARNDLKGLIGSEYDARIKK